MSSFSAQNTSNGLTANAVDASQWPGAFDAPLSASGPATAYWACDLLYPSPNCSDRPSWTPSQVTSIISNMGKLTHCLASFVAEQTQSVVKIPSCPSDALSQTMMGDYMCQVLTIIDNRLDAMSGTISSTPPTSNSPSIPSDHFGSGSEYLGAPVRWISMTIPGIPGVITIPSYT